MEMPPENDQYPPTPSNVGGKIVRLLLPIALLVAGWFGFSQLSVKPEAAREEEQEAKPIKTRVTELEVCDFRTVVTTQGTIRSHEEVPLSSQVAGEIVRIHQNFEDGAFFEKGEILLELDPSDFEAALAAAESEKVRAEVALAQEEARAEQARLNWERLGKQDEPGELVLRLPQLKEARANLAAATAAYGRAQRDLERTKISAPFAGRVRTRDVGLGQTIATATPLGTVFAIDYAEVRLPLSSRDLALLDLPEDASDPAVAVVLTDGLNLENPATWEARIVRTEGVLDPDSLELFAIARISDPFGRESGEPPLRFGQPVVARIEGKILERVLALPRGAVFQLDQIRLIDKGDLTLSSRTITPLWSDEDHVLIRDPSIDPGTQALALTRLVYAPEGAKVEIVPNIDDSNDDDLTLDADGAERDDTSS